MEIGELRIEKCRGEPRREGRNLEASRTERNERRRRELKGEGGKMQNDQCKMQNGAYPAWVRPISMPCR